MASRIAIIAASDSFSEVWADLAAFAGAQVEVGATVGDVRRLQDTCGVLVAAGGVEDRVGDVLRELQAARSPDAVVAGADTSYRTVATILRSGASNYFAMPCDIGLCRSWFVDRVERDVDRRNGEQFAADERDRFDFSRLIGQSPRLRAALRRTASVIPRASATILLTGETGTGKELLARAIHYNGARASGPFVEINCTTLPEHLLEAELFGYEAGAFTDARVAKPGLFEVANKGTMFLDEIGDLPPQLQGKLLRVLEEKRVRRLGSVRDVDIDLRIIAATHVNLPEAIRNGRFRQDLYYRLNVVPIRLPALRERGEDIMLLVNHFLDRYCREYEVQVSPLTATIKRSLRVHPWPGNVRELRNSIERAVLLGDGNIFEDDLFPDELFDDPTAGVLPFPASMQAIQQAAARQTVERYGGNKSEAAKVLGISRKHLYSLLSAGGSL